VEKGLLTAGFYGNERVPVPDDWYSLFPNPVVSESILDRLVNSAHHVHMDGKSYRPTKRPGAKGRVTS
jgi:hypothetical protein